MTKKMFGRRNRNGLTVDDLRALVADASSVGPYVKLKARTKMNGTLIELTIDEPDEAAQPDPWTPPPDHFGWDDTRVEPRFSPPTEPPNT